MALGGNSAALALALDAMRKPTRGRLLSAAAGSFVLAVVHPTYAIFLWIPFAGFVGVLVAVPLLPVLEAALEVHGGVVALLDEQEEAHDPGHEDGREREQPATHPDQVEDPADRSEHEQP